MKIELKRETITFRDGTKIELAEADWVHSLQVGEMELAERKRQEAELLAEPELLNDEIRVKERSFRLNFWPKLVCSAANGHVPFTMEEALELPGTEILKWYEASKRVNPDWWNAPDELPEDATPAEVETVKKKGGKSG